MILDDLTTRILGAILAGDRTGPAIASRVGSDPFTVHRRLEILRTEGLITWTPGTQGTIRPLVEAHPPVIA
jgi:predicted transcriptional regulator